MWGVWWIPLRAVEGAGVGGDWASALLFAIGALAVSAVAAARRADLRAGTAAFWLVGILTGTAWSFWNHALISGDVVRVTLLFYLSPIWATLLARAMLGEPFGWLRGLSIALGLGGAVVVLGFGGGIPVPRTMGEWMGLGSGLLFAAATIVIRKTGAAGLLGRSLGSFLCGTAASAALALVGSAEPPAGAAIVASLPYLAVSLFWLLPLSWMVLWGAGHLDPGRVNILLLLEAVTAAISASILTDEPFGWREFAGCILIVGAGLIEGLAEMRGRAMLRQPA